MNWNHWSEKEPEDGELILVYEKAHKNYQDLGPTIGKQVYKKYGDAWEYFKAYPEKRIGWTHWIPIKDIPLPEDRK